MYVGDMGSFSMTCALSGLGIGTDDPVRVFFLNEEGDDPLECTIYSRWSPRSIPFRAVYAGYGMVDRVHVQDIPLMEAAVKAFDEDLAVVGWGSNLCHEKETRKGMQIGDLFEAASKDRLRVREVGLPTSAVPLPKGYPTKKRLAAALSKFKPLKKAFEGEGYVLRRIRRGLYTVRWHGDHQFQRLQSIASALNEYATMISKDMGPYPSQAQLWVAPRTQVELPIGDAHKSEVKRVRFALIREDVWQALAHNSAPPEKKDWVPAMVRDIEKLHKAWQQHPTLWPCGLGRDFAAMLYSRDRPFMVGLAKHAQILWEMGGYNPETCQSMAEFAALFRWVVVARKLWVPSSVAGPQVPDRQAELAFARHIYTLASQTAVQQAKFAAQLYPNPDETEAK